MSGSRAAVSPKALEDLAAGMAAASGGENAAMAAIFEALAAGLLARQPANTNGNPPAGLPDNEIGDDAIGVSNPKGHDDMKIFGPYPHKKRWRIVIRQGDSQKAQGFDTECEAKAEVRRLRLEARRQGGLTVEKAIETYTDQLRRNGVRERSIATTRYRLRKLFEPVLSVPLPTVTPARAREMYAKVEGSVDSRRNILNQARTFCRRAKESGWTDTILLADVKGEGRRHCGKQKLTVDESRKFLTACLDLADSANPKEQTVGVGAAMALVFGMRASEITGLQVRDLDADGTIIRITHAKSQAGIRSLQVPEWFRPYLQRLADGKAATDTLVGHNRTWLHRNVRAICKKAGVTQAPPHGLRGTHADLALSAAATPLSVSKALGHSSTAVTFRHYADPGIAASHDHERAVEALSPRDATFPN